jgi:hypothetical protein
LAGNGGKLIFVELDPACTDAPFGWEEPALIADSYRRNLDWLNYWVLDKPYRDPQKQAAYDAWKQERRAAH